MHVWAHSLSSGVQHTYLSSYFVVVKRMPLLVVVKFVHTIDFVNGTFRAFDLVHLNSGVGHSCGVPHLVTGPPYINKRASRKRVQVWSVHSRTEEVERSGSKFP